jgi:hypothetical protein
MEDETYIIVKTEEFNRKFLYDLADLTIVQNEYLNSIKKFDSEGRLLNIGYGRQPSRNVKFVGSYTEKNIGNYITDIDVNIIVSLNDHFFDRLKNILENIDKTPFIFTNFYYGYIQGLEPAWSIGEKGECDFNLEKVNKWFENTKNYPEIYEKVKPYLSKNTISMMDILTVNKILEPYISLNWTKDEIIQGYKIYNGVRYDFRKIFTESKKYKVLEFMYKYKNIYCSVDLKIIPKDSVVFNESYRVYYYNENKYELYKSLKRKIRNDKIPEYLEERKKAIGHITPLLFFIEYANKIKKYNLIPQEKLTTFIRTYADTHKIATIDYDKLKRILREKITPLYQKYKQFIKDEYKEDNFVLEIRTLQLNEQVPKSLIEKRQKAGYDCTLFPMNAEHIKFIYRKARDTLIDPYKLYDCIIKSSHNTKFLLPWLITNIFVKKNYKIRKEQDTYSLYLDDKKIESSTELKPLQLTCLIGKKETEKSDTWYVQWSKPFAKFVEERRGERDVISLIYEKGNAVMKKTPQVGDKALVLSEKNIIYKGIVISEHERGYGLRLTKIEPVYVGKWFRRNWNLQNEK